MRVRTLYVVVVCGLAAGTFGCTSRRTPDQVTQGVQGPTSPAESAQHGADAYNRAPYGEDKAKIDAEHQTAGLMPEYTNGKIDPTMEGSGNLAWQGSYERRKRAKAAQ